MHSARENQADNGQKGLDPLGRNMASPAAIARGFGVTSRLLNDPRYIDREPVKVDGDDVPLVSTAELLSPQLWQRRPFKRGNLPLPSHSASELHDVWLPRDVERAQYMVDMYFKRLNYHRPIFEQGDFNRRFKMLYSNESTTPDDVGFICSTYLILALATLSEMHQPNMTEASVAELKAIWPTHEAFLSRALAVKPELRLTISSLQALLLLQWYLYSEVSPLPLSFFFSLISRYYRGTLAHYGGLSASWFELRSNWDSITIQRCNKRLLPPKNARSASISGVV
jgi:hypothetical protein